MEFDLRYLFLDAATVGDVDEVRRLVDEEGVDPSCQDPDGWCALRAACKNQHLDIVRYLVEEAQVDAHNNALDQRGWTALHYVCGGSMATTTTSLRLISYLVETVGIDVNTRTNCGSTPLHMVAQWATNAGNTTIRFLVEHLNADLHVKDDRGETPLCKAFTRGGGSVRVANRDYLLSKMESVDEKVLSIVWKFKNPWRVKKSVLEKYASGQGQSDQFAAFPIHTLMHFPLPSELAFKECIVHFPLSSLSILDNHGRLPIHVLLSSSNPSRFNTPSIFGLLFDLEPRSALVRDPTTGFYPYETAAHSSAINGSTGVANRDYLLSKMESVDEKVVSIVWLFKNPWRIRKSVVEKYASGQGQSDQFTTFPIHTLMHFPLPFSGAFQDCIENFPLSSLSILDNHGRLPMHVLLSSSNPRLNHPRLAVHLFDLEPRSALARDPTTGFYPYETAAHSSAINGRSVGDSKQGVSAVYTLFRGDPAYLLRTRGVVGGSVVPNLDNHGRLPIHVLLSSPNETLNTPSMVHFLYHPRSAVTRDPTTSLYPYEAEALLTAANDRRRSSFGSETLLNTVYELFRAEPARFLQTRGLVGCGDGSSSSSEETVKTAGAALIPRTSGQHTDFRPLNKQANIE
eukprot:CAMPEP_0194066218 /NCGR_PEP_ID=MMETSP0009_2-20130614/85898_1 /TAXON_ID=210454 /ORGANISM="Grammatophora oceanica, Strain CCMP 410" /LENGTH=627 /DNA_ID=CAMNT_0038719147 /DNA_START=68 /DNA_END=1950 /DNA_ORIENTATION=+